MQPTAIERVDVGLMPATKLAHVGGAYITIVAVPELQDAVARKFPLFVEHANGTGFIW